MESALAQTRKQVPRREPFGKSTAQGYGRLQRDGKTGENVKFELWIHRLADDRCIDVYIVWN